VQLPAAGLQAASFRSTRRLLRHQLHGLCDADRTAHHEAFISRHRLRKKDPSARVSEAGASRLCITSIAVRPSQVRSALIEGARWWNQAFEAIGYKDAFRVEVMPADVDPMDVALQRYSVGTSDRRAAGPTGNSLVDPRTGRDNSGPCFAGLAARSAGLPDR
jgi:hypothetical protein